MPSGCHSGCPTNLPVIFGNSHVKHWASEPSAFIINRSVFLVDGSVILSNNIFECELPLYHATLPPLSINLCITNSLDGMSSLESFSHPAPIIPIIINSTKKCFNAFLFLFGLRLTPIDVVCVILLKSSPK